MSFARRQLLQILSYAFGSSFILPRNAFAMAAQNPAQPASPAPPAKAAAKHADTVCPYNGGWSKLAGGTFPAAPGFIRRAVKPRP